MVSDAGEILKATFGFDRFRPLQGEVIDTVLKHNDSLVIMPTGGGKSLCYQIPALIFDGLTIVVSPLISLMQDQVSQLLQVGVSARFLNSSLSVQQYDQTLNEIKSSKIRLLYVAPETLLKPQVINILRSIDVSCLAIDEAHCISEWGHDFRPEYRKLSGLRNEFARAVVIALTATATTRVRQDIIDTLALKDASQFVGSFNRANLFLEVKAKNKPEQQVREVLEKFLNQSGIIYCATRKKVNELSEMLINEGFSAAPYHAGLSDTERRNNQEAFVRDDLQVIVATLAFGMGIDKPNVRFVIHYDLPKNVEGYYQEIGRAGRDGLDAHCLLLFSYGDIHKIKFFIDQKSDHEKRLAQSHLDAIIGYAECTLCRRIPLLAYFGEVYDSAGQSNGCGMCDICLGNTTLVDITVSVQKFLSCVKRTGELFGIVHIIDVLLGSKNKKVLEHQHQNVSTYGIGTELTKKQWSHLGRQCVQHGLLISDPKFGSLKLTAKAWEILRGQLKFDGVIIADDRKKYKKITRTKALVSTDYDRDLFSILRITRKKLADRANIPPYAVFPDRTLIELAAKLPETLEQLPAIHGIGKVKLDKYGMLFLTEIRNYTAHKKS